MDLGKLIKMPLVKKLQLAENENSNEFMVLFFGFVFV
jgi:hypothetical protein